MTSQELQNDYPNVYLEFERYFDREGWGSNSASELSGYGFDEWYSDFIRDYEIDSVDDYEKELSDYLK